MVWHRRARSSCAVAEVSYRVVRPDRLAPPRDQRLVHRRDRGERPTIEPERAAVAEMRIAGEEDRHVIPEAFRRGPQATVRSVKGKSSPLNKMGTSSARGHAKAKQSPML